jgi:Tol biopolymer transport system component
MIRLVLLASLAVTLTGAAAPQHPSGSILFTGKLGDGDWGLFAVNADGSVLRRVLATDWSGFVSPDGRRLAVPGISEMWVGAASGRGSRRLKMVGRDTGLAWAPDSKRFAFTTSESPYPDQDQTYGGVFVVNAVTGDRKRLPVQGANTTWSPDSRRLAIDTANGIVVIGADGDGERWLADGRAPTWSPDGQWIAFLRGRDVYLVRPDGGGLRRLARSWSAETLDLSGSSGSSWNLRWAPGGRRLAYVARTAGVEQVRVVDEITRQHKTVAKGAEPAWAPDGRALAFSRDPNEICVVQFPTGTVRCLNPGFEFARRPQWLNTTTRATEVPTTEISLNTAGAITTALPVDRMSANGSRVAFVTDDCAPLTVWDAATGARKRVRMHVACDDEPYVEVALGRSRLAVSIDYPPDMDAEPTKHEVWMVDADGTRPRLLANDLYAELDVGRAIGPPAMVGDQAVYTRWQHAVGGILKRPTVVVDRRRIASGRNAGPVADADAARILVSRSDGLVVLRPDGRVEQRLRAAPAAELADDTVVTLERGLLRVWDVRSGALRRTRRIAASAEPVRLLDAGAGFAAYRRGAVLHLLRLSDGRDFSVRGMGGGLVRLTERGLFHASGSRVRFIRVDALTTATR